MMEKNSSSGADPLFLQVQKLGQSLRRAAKPKADRLPATPIEHQGPNAFLRSWSDKNGQASRQELLFLDRTITYQQNSPLRTGRKQNNAFEGGPELLEFDTNLSIQTLELASHLLREAPRDYFIQHLMQQIHEALEEHFNLQTTQVTRLRTIRDTLRRASAKLSGFTDPKAALALYIGLGVAVGAMVALVLIVWLSSR